MLQDFQDLGFFEKGSVQKIVNDLSNNDFVNWFVECYSDAKASYLIFLALKMMENFFILEKLSCSNNIF